MSGQTAIRGFTYQTIVSVIKSLTNNDWTYVQVEPNTENDKVDILWEYKDQKMLCQQVKSSIHNFSKSDITQWLEKMKQDVPDASSYELILIGNMSTGTDSFINELKEEDAKVEVIIFNLEFLESRVRDEVSKFLSANGFHLPHPTIYLISGGLIYQFFNFSVLARRVSKHEFSDHLLTWVKSNYSKDLGIVEKTAKFTVLFYDKPGKTFLQQIDIGGLRNSYPDLLSEQLHVVYTNYIEAAKLKLDQRTIQPTEIESGPIQKLISLSVPSDAGLSRPAKSLIKNSLKELFDIGITDDFFNVGNLRENYSVLTLPFNNGIEYIGTAVEKAKMEALNHLRWELETFTELKKFSDQIDEYRPLTLVLQNSGTTFDEEIAVTLQLPIEVEIALPENLYVPDDLGALEKIITIRYFRQVFRIQEDSSVSGYEYSPLADFDPDGSMEIFYKMSGHSEKLKYKRRKLMRQADAIFEYEFFNDLAGFYQLRFHFNKVNPNIRMAFPFHLFVKSVNDFEITYDIKTKNSSAIYQGTLKCMGTVHAGVI
jgi:hypothetical protein